MTPNLQVLRHQLLWGCMACAPWWGLAQAQAQKLEALVLDALITLAATPSQRAQVASARAGVDSSLAVFPTPSVVL